MEDSPFHCYLINLVFRAEEKTLGTGLETRTYSSACWNQWIWHNTYQTL